MAQEYSKLHFRRRKSLTVNPKVCSGCRTCEVICSLGHEGAIDLERSRLYVRTNPFKGLFAPVICRQCSDAPCLQACPVSAIRIDQELGTVMIDPNRCDGCRLCQEACPYHVIRIDQDSSKALKCDLCRGDPQCVQWCPTNALGVAEFGGSMPK
jgi:carbon-monoxide dehydrogenase iron sulfur subunit